jgi:hypothetical protein
MFWRNMTPPTSWSKHKPSRNIHENRWYAEFCLHYVPENRTLHNHCCENLKFYILHFSGSGEGSVLGSCENGNEPLGSTKCEKFLDLVSASWHLRKDLA